MMTELFTNGSFENYVNQQRDREDFDHVQLAGGWKRIPVAGNGAPEHSVDGGYEYDETQWRIDSGSSLTGPFNLDPDQPSVTASDGNAYLVFDPLSELAYEFDEPLSAGYYKMSFDYFVETLNYTYSDLDNRTSAEGHFASFIVHDRPAPGLAGFLIDPTQAGNRQGLVDSTGETDLVWKRAEFTFEVREGTTELEFSFTSFGNSAIPPLVYFDNASFRMVCFNRGTLIDTETGAVAIENIAVGDKVWTADGEYSPVRWIGSRHLTRAEMRANPKLLPIRIRAGALGQNTPDKDLIVSRQHRILVRSIIAERMFGVKEVLIPAIKLLTLDGIDILSDVDEVEYWHFLCDSHKVVMSNGALTESLFTGPEALKALSPEARQEFETLFPEIASPSYKARSARKIPERHKDMERLAQRHHINNHPVVETPVIDKVV